jgi:hypothetical protein
MAEPPMRPIPIPAPIAASPAPMPAPMMAKLMSNKSDNNIVLSIYVKQTLALPSGISLIHQ